MRELSIDELDKVSGGWGWRRQGKNHCGGQQLRGGDRKRRGGGHSNSHGGGWGCGHVIISCGVGGGSGGIRG